MVSIETVMAEQRMRDLQGRVHNFCSAAGNALERISILIDEEEVDEAKHEIEELRDALSRISADA